MLVNHLIVICITSYLIRQIIQSRRQMASVSKSVFYPAMAFLFTNWFFTFWMIMAASYAAIQWHRFDKDINIVEMQPLTPFVDSSAAFLYLLQNVRE